MAAKAKTLHIICGPTAVGKTAFSIDLAEQLGTELISADSRQLYREIPIGTAQPSAEELSRVKHHFIASRSVTENYNAGLFADDALALLNQLFLRYDDVVMCGGTGLYIQGVVDGFDDLPKANEAIRAEVEAGYESGGIEWLQSELKRLDPIHYQSSDISNKQRLMRAIEVCMVSGKTYTELRTGTKAERPFQTKKIGLTMPRQKLNERINQRVDLMMEMGLLDEVKSVHHLKDTNALQTLGYRELFDFMEEKYSLEEALEKMKTNTRRFAKRQMTWFKRDERVGWVEV
jgi:tRNA dimethylallyltransferase